MDKIWAIILAAGESKRMGSPKMLLPFGGKTMLETVIDNVKGSCVDQILVVLGAEKTRITALIEKLPVKYCYNYNYKEGMLSSVKCGFRNIGECRAVLVYQGDQPLISAEVTDRMIDVYRSSDKGILIPVYRKKRGHPLLVDARYKDEIEGIDPAIGLRALAEKHPEDILEVETDEPGILRDFDTYEEYKREINQKS